MNLSIGNDAESITKVDESGQLDYEHEKFTGQTHPTITTLPLSKGIIYCYVLSMWDNIVGPKAAYIWNTRSNSYEETNKKVDHINEISSCHSNGAVGDKRKNTLILTDVIKYVAEHSISLGDVNKLSKKHVTSWLAAPHQNIAFLSIRFALEEFLPKVPCSLSCITYYETRYKLRPYLEICSSEMQIIANKVSILFNKEGLPGVKKVTEDLIKLTTTISSLIRANLSMCIPDHLPETPVNRHLAAIMLTSHLQTLCSTLVIAGSLNVANKVILWLSQFSPEKNLKSSCLCLSENKCSYSSGPYIQAVIPDCHGQVDLPTTNMLCSGLPLTIVDLTKDTVRQFTPSASQQKICYQALHTELVDLYGGCKCMGAISRSIFRPVDVIAPLIKTFLQEWNCLAECDPAVRKRYLNAFKQSLYYNALSVSVFVRNKCQEIKYDEKSEQELKPEFLLREIKCFLQIEESDIKVILAKAESFDPGITSFVFR